jgi:hypothetical protein
MSNQSSVEWLLKELTEIGVLNIKNCHWSDEVDIKKAIEQAVAMHKEEIINAWRKGDGVYDKVAEEMSLEYYNETFGGAK